MVSTHTLEHPKSAVARFDSLIGLTPGGVTTRVLRNYCRSAGIQIPALEEGRAVALLEC